MSEAPAADLLIAHDSVDLESVEQLASALDRSGIRPLLFSERDFENVSGDPVAALAPARAVMIVVAIPSTPDFLFQLARAARATPDGVERPLFVALLREANERVARGLSAEEADVLDLRSGINENLVAGFASSLRLRLDGPPPNFTKQAPPPNFTKQAPLPNEPAAPVDAPTSSSQPDISEIWGALDDDARGVLAQAAAVAESHESSLLLHSEDLLIGLYREPDGPTGHILQDAGVTEAAVASMVAQLIPSISPAARLADAPDVSSAPPLSSHTTAALTWAFATARASDPTAKITTQQLLAGLVSLTDCSVAEKLRDAKVSVESVLAWRRPEPEPVPLAVAGSNAGFTSDTTGGPDLLDIGPEVDAIATVLSADSVDPPLALGLFGDWGTGKTFFMDELEKRIALLAAREAKTDRHGEPRVYCRNIVQLRFNAWHYIDVDLWASLASAIFEGLDDALAKQDLDTTEVESRGKERASLLLRRGQVQERLERRRRCQAEADRRAAAAQAEVDQVDGMHDELVASIQPGAVVAGGVSVVLAQPEVARFIETERGRFEEAVNEAVRKAGVEPETYNKQLAKRPDNGYGAALRTLFDLKAMQLWLPIALLALAAVALTAILSALGVNAAALLGIAVPLVVGVVGPLRPVIDAAATIFRVYRDARRKGEELVDAKREKLRERAVTKKKRREKVARKFANGVQSDQAELDQVDKRLTELRPGREMADFVRIRQASNDYKSRLGVVARARDDFEELSRLLAKDKAEVAAPTESGGAITNVDGTDEPGAAGPTAIERIILYIDDLDRCKEKEVVAVLQAVHLLLAFPLFVVVVAVDPRWLLHSLRVESGVFAAKQEGLTDDDEDGLGWEATPLNYLEKIFQIPFALRPMGETGFGKIINNLVGYDEKGGSTDQSNGHAGTETLQTVSQLAFPPEDGNGSGPSPGLPTDKADAVATEAAPAQATAVALDAGAADQAVEDGEVHDDDATRPVEMNPRALDISDPERLCMATMYPLIGTPRGAKRFVNVYRLLKASRPVDEQGRFADPKVHRSVLLLLASLTGFPRETAEILRALVEDKPGGTWWDFVLPFAKERAAEETKAEEPLRAASWEQLIAKLGQVRAADSRALSSKEMRDRAHWVARYSFESSRILSLEAEDTKAQAAKTRSPKPRAAKATATKNPVRSKAGSGAGRAG